MGDRQKKKDLRLKLKKEPLRVLGWEELGQVVGGVPVRRITSNYCFGP